MLQITAAVVYISFVTESQKAQLLPIENPRRHIIITNKDRQKHHNIKNGTENQRWYMASRHDQIRQEKQGNTNVH